MVLGDAGFFKSLEIFFMMMLCLLAAGCSQAVKSSSPTDTPKNHYEAGLKLLSDKDPAKPLAEFQRAILLDKKSPFGYAGMAELEFKRQNWKKAIKHADKAINLDSKFADSAILKAQALIAAKDDDWFDRTVETLRQVLRYAPDDERAHYFLGEACLHANRFEETQNYYQKVIEIKGKLSSQAADRLRLVGRIMEQNPSTLHGKQIVQTVSITRAETCVLLIEEMRLKDLLKNRRLSVYEEVFGEDGVKRKMPPDIELRSDRKDIHDILKIRIPGLDVFPNGHFYPDRTITRAQFAIIVQDIMTLLNDDVTLSSRYNGADSPFPDIRPDYHAFNAIMNAVEWGIMASAPKTDRFDPEGIVSGIDALTIIRALGRAVSSQ